MSRDGRSYDVQRPAADPRPAPSRARADATDDERRRR